MRLFPSQCVQIFFVKMREILLKMREKMRQPKMSKMSTFYCIFGRFRGGLLLDFFEIFFKILFYQILLHKIQTKSKCASFSVSRALREIKKPMREEGSKCATFAQNHNIWTHCTKHKWPFSPSDSDSHSFFSSAFFAF